MNIQLNKLPTTYHYKKNSFPSIKESLTHWVFHMIVDNM